MSKGKVAFCFSGQMRAVQRTYEGHIKPNLMDCNEEYEIHCFVHTWFSKKDVGVSYHVAGDKAKTEPIPVDVVAKVYEYYDPKKMLLEEQVEFDEKEYAKRKSRYIVPRYTLSKNYSLMQVGKLVRQYEEEQNFKYDLVVQLRMDWGISSPILFDETKPEPNKVITSTQANHAIDVSHGVMDSDTFQLYADFYNDIDKCFQEGVKFADEDLMLHYLGKHNIAIERRGSHANYHLIR